MERGINGICSQFCPAAPRGARPAFRGAGRPSLIYIYSNKKLYTVKKCVILDIYLSVCAFTSNRDDIFIFQRELNEPTVNKKIIKIWQLICFKLLRLKCRHITTTVKYIIIWYLPSPKNIQLFLKVDPPADSVVGKVEMWLATKYKSPPDPDSEHNCYRSKTAETSLTV